MVNFDFLIQMGSFWIRGGSNCFWVIYCNKRRGSHCNYDSYCSTLTVTSLAFKIIRIIIKYINILISFDSNLNPEQFKEFVVQELLFLTVCQKTCRHVDIWLDSGSVVHRKCYRKSSVTEILLLNLKLH